MTDTSSGRDIFAVSDAAVERLAVANPLVATMMGIPGRDNEWPDLSPAGHGAMRDLLAGVVDEAKACEIPDRRHRLAKDVLVEFCQREVDDHDDRQHHYDLNNITSAHQRLQFVFGSQAADSPEAWEAIIERLATIGEPLDGFRQTLEEGRAAGRTVSRRQVNAVIEQGNIVVGDHSSFHQLRTKLADAPFDANGLASRLDDAIDAAKEAYRSFNGYLDHTYLPDAMEADAVGIERYRRAAAGFLGTDIDLHETYRWGWDEVERLWGELQQACAAIDPDVPAAAVFDQLQTDPAYAVATEAEFVDVMLERQHQALAALEGVHFDVPEAIREIDVQVEPAGGAAAAHYIPPSEDFSRPGSVWYPVAGKTHFPLFREVTIAYHEGFPGHHLQIGVQTTMGDELSRFHRKIAWYPGSGEGWALYAEHLMGELGYLERPEYVIGLLASQMFRACRVAIDIGVHLDLPIPDDVTFHPGERWSYDLAFELLTERGLDSPASAASEVIRYFGWPGQAISYKVGEKAILDLRAEHAAASGYDPKAFHSKLLSVGSVGLDLLRAEMAD